MCRWGAVGIPAAPRHICRARREALDTTRKQAYYTNGIVGNVVVGNKGDGNKLDGVKK
jgi:hypothetical protein